MHHGLLKYKRPIYRVAYARANFQHAAEDVLQGILGTDVYLNDIIVTRRSEDDYEWNLNQTLKELEDSGLTLHVKKSEFSMCHVNYFGYLV